MTRGSSNLTAAREASTRRRRPDPDARYVAIVVHGYAEHVGRYAHVIERLLADGATVYGLDHLGHGRSEGERALVTEGEHLTADLGLLVTLARSENPGLPLVMIGHSMGGLIATRYAQTHPGRARRARALGSGDRRGTRRSQRCWSSTRSPRSRSTRRCCPATRRSARPTSRTRSSTAARSKPRRCAPCSRRWPRWPRGQASASLPVLWVHGAEDAARPLRPGRRGVRARARRGLRGEGIFPAPATRSSTRPTATRSSTTWSRSSTLRSRRRAPAARSRARCDGR